MNRTEAPSDQQEAASARATTHGRGTALVPPARAALDGADEDPPEYDAEDHIVRGID